MRRNVREWQPELRTLRYFVCVAEEKSITRAAERLMVAQPALSRQIAKLEDDLGLSVFARTSRGVELTEEGGILLIRCYAILEQISQAHHDVTAHVEEPRGVVVLGIPPTPGEFIAPLLLTYVKAQYPEIELRFIEGFSRELEGKLARGEIGIAVMHNPPEKEEIVSKPLLTDRLYLISPPETHLRESIQLSEAASLPLVMPSRQNFLRTLVDRHVSDMKMHLNVTQHVDGLWHLKSLVRHGHGHSILTYGAVISEVQQGTLTAVPITNPVIDWPLAIATKTDQQKKRAIQVVELAIQEITKKLVSEGIWK